MKLAYISAPMTLGSGNHNWFQAAEAQVKLMKAGYAVHNPIQALMLPSAREFRWDEWLEMDEAIIDRCDLLVVLPGESRGVQREVKYARSKMIPVMTLEEALTMERKGVYVVGNWDAHGRDSSPHTIRAFEELEKLGYKLWNGRLWNNDGQFIMRDRKHWWLRRADYAMRLPNADRGDLELAKHRGIPVVDFCELVDLAAA